MSDEFIRNEKTLTDWLELGATSVAKSTAMRASAETVEAARDFFIPENSNKSKQRQKVATLNFIVHSIVNRKIDFRFQISFQFSRSVC
jgi:hypothetical protein